MSIKLYESWLQILLTPKHFIIYSYALHIYCFSGVVVSAADYLPIGPGFDSRWVHPSSAPNWFIKGLVCTRAARHIKDPLGLFEKSS